MESLTSATCGEDLKGLARALRSALLKGELKSDQAVQALEQFERWAVERDVLLLLYVRSCVSALLSAIHEAKVMQAAYRFIFALDDELGADRVVSLRALVSGVKHGTHRLYTISNGELPTLDADGPICVVMGRTTDDAIEVRDAVTRLRVHYPDRRIVSYLGGQTEIDALGSKNQKYFVADQSV